VCPECGEAGDGGTCTKHDVPRVPVGTDALLGEQIGSWRIARLIGAGGMGRVYLGVQPDIGARVAIKVLKDADDAALVERFFNEARAVNLIHHEGIVDVIDLGRLPGGEPYIVMEYLEGVPLRALVKRDPRPHAGALAKVIADVLAALDAAHAQHIIHRDLKPDNVFVSPGGRVTVLDFGIAKLARDAGTQTKTGGLLGTPAYMSPEQARSQPIDARSDLYAVGVILYEAATGVIPFSAPSLYDLLDQHVKSAPKPPRAIDPAIPEALEAVILRALAKDPADRYATAAEMRAALLTAIEPLPKPELELPSITSPRRVVTSDPGGPTQATQPSAVRARTPPDSLAYGDTRASGEQSAAAGTMTGRGSAPVERDTVRVSRGLIAVMAGSALLGLGAVAYVVVRDREPAPERVVAVAADAMTAILVDAPPDATIARPIDADAAPPIDAPQKPEPRPPAPPPDLMKGPVELAVPNAKRFDPVAYYKTALAKAEWVAGGPVRPTAVTWRKFDRKGRIDLTTTGSAEYIFAMKTPKPDNFCYVLVILEDGAGRLSIGSGSNGCARGVQTPRCSIAQLWEKAIAGGVSPDATEASVNLMGRWWMFSTPGDPTTHELENACE